MNNPQRRHLMQQGVVLGAVALIGALGTWAHAADAKPYAITFHDDKVVPQTLTVPAGERVEVEITNARSAPSEFESSQLSREKVVPGGTRLNLWIGPLKAGKYRYFDDFNPAVVGWIEAVETRK